MRASLAALLLLAAVSCRPKEAPPQQQPSAAEVSTSSTSPWRVAQGGPSPRLALSGEDLAVSAFAGPRSLDAGLPGVSLGDARGPRYGLLGGYFAPLVLAASSSTAWALRVEGGPREATFTFEAPGQRSLVVRALPPRDGRAVLVLEGSGTVLLPADRTELRGELGGRPSVATAITGGGTPGGRGLAADRLEIATRKLGTVVIETSCPRVRLVRVVPRGSTSVFALHLGPGPIPTDPLWSPGEAPGEAPAACPEAVTSTLTLPWPPPDGAAPSP